MNYRDSIGFRFKREVADKFLLELDKRNIVPQIFPLPNGDVQIEVDKQFIDDLIASVKKLEL